jgi:hypothetical protein
MDHDLPVFPRFKPLELSDRALLHPLLWGFQPRTSELTFTNLFIWRNHFGFEWSLLDDRLVVVASSPEGNPGGAWALPPVGPAPRAGIARAVLERLREERGPAAAQIRRADRDLIEELGALPGFAVSPGRDDFDYVYLSRDLIELSGSRYHGKRNHIARFVEAHDYRYEPLETGHVPGCLETAEVWCALKRCEDDLDLLGEHETVKEALTHFTALGLSGGVILVGGEIKAFALGELLNDRTAVIHVEKADPRVQGLYPVINRDFCRRRWAGTTYVNREQDLGDPGLRRAKMSYHPDHLEEKFVVSPEPHPAGHRP